MNVRGRIPTIGRIPGAAGRIAMWDREAILHEYATRKARNRCFKRLFWLVVSALWLAWAVAEYRDFSARRDDGQFGEVAR